MTDLESATYLRANLARRLSGREIQTLDAIIERGFYDDDEDEFFESMKTEFAAELRHATEAPASRETPDDEGGGLL